MARSITVQFADGSSHTYQNAPDDITPEVVTQRATQDFGKQVTHLDGGKTADLPTHGQKLWSAIKDAGSGLQSMATDVVRGAGTALSGLSEGAGAFNDSERAMFTKPKGRNYNEMSQGVRNVLPTPENDSMPRQYLRAGLEVGGGALVTGGTGLVNLAAGIGSGVGGKAMEEMAPNNPLAKLGGNVTGAVLGGGPAALLSRGRPQSANVAKELIEGTTPAELQASQDLANKSAAAGKPMDLAQAYFAVTGKVGNLAAFRDFTAGRGKDNKLQTLLQEQPEILSTEAGLRLAGMPGNLHAPGQTASNIQETASKAVQAAVKARTDAVKADYAKAGNLPDSARSELGAILNQYATQPGAASLLKERAKEMAQKLQGNDPMLANAVTAARTALQNATTPAERVAAQQQLQAANAAAQSAGTKPLHAADVDTWIGELRGAYNGTPLKIAFPKEQGQIKGLAGALNARFSQMSPAVAAADAKFQQISRDVVSPLKQSQVGNLAQPGGYLDDKAAVVTKFTQLMNTGTIRGASTSELATTTKELAKIDKTAVEDGVKQWLADKIAKASDTPAIEGGPATNADFAKRLYDGIFSDPKRWQGLKDVTSQMAIANGENPDTVIRGLDNFRQITAAMSLRPSGPAGLRPADIERLGGNSNMANAVRVMSFLPANRLGEGIERATLGKTLAEFDTILTSKEGNKMLAKLAKEPVMSRKAALIIGGWAGGSANPPGLQSDNPPE